MSALYHNRVHLNNWVAEELNHTFDNIESHICILGQVPLSYWLITFEGNLLQVRYK